VRLDLSRGNSGAFWSIGLGDSLKARIRRYKELCAHYGMTPSRNMRMKTARSRAPTGI
jgi:hypothetical protein